MPRIDRWWWIVRCHRPEQLGRRALGVVRRRVARLGIHRRWNRVPQGVARRRDGVDFSAVAEARLAARPAIAGDTAAVDVLNGQFRFLNVARELPDPIDWRLGDWPDAPALWRFHLHYHEFLLDLVRVGSADPRAIDRAWDLVRQWLESYQTVDARAMTSAWHPFCISRRLPVWIVLWTVCPPTEQLKAAVMDSIYCQTRYLARHLEKDLGGNHLLENLRALLLAAAFLDGPAPDRWLQRAARQFQQQLDEQVVPHGEHFERSPMYHGHMLEAVLDVRDVIRPMCPELADCCADVAAKMARFLQLILHPDGEIPLFGDSCLRECPPAKCLIERADMGRSSRQDAKGQRR